MKPNHVMKAILPRQRRWPHLFILTICIALFAEWHCASAADPRVDSWFTENSGKYARIFQTTADEASGASVTTWSRGQGTQSLPVYAGVREISSSANWVYIRSSGLASYVMGPS